MGGMGSRTTKGLGDRNTVRDGENVDFQSDLEHFGCERNSLLVLRFSSIMYVCNKFPTNEPHRNVQNQWSKTRDIILYIPSVRLLFFSLCVYWSQARIQHGAVSQKPIVIMPLTSLMSVHLSWIVAVCGHQELHGNTSTRTEKGQKKELTWREVGEEVGLPVVEICLSTDRSKLHSENKHFESCLLVV